MKAVTVFYSPTCPFSAAAVSFVFTRGADVHLVNLEEHPEARARLEGQLEKQSKGKRLETPVFEAEGVVHAAPSLGELKKLLEAWGLSPAAGRAKLQRAPQEPGPRH
jgi:glutaredoxin